MRPVIATFLAITILAGCGTPKEATVPSVHSKANVAVFSYSDSGETKPMLFFLKGDYGIVLRHDPVSAIPSKLTYELFSKQSGRMLTTQDLFEFRMALKNMSASARVDFYDTCTFSLSTEKEKSMLRFCDALGIAGGYYVMCTDLGCIGKPRPWRWKRGAEPAISMGERQTIGLETNTTSSATNSYR